MGNASHQHITPRGYLNAWAVDGLVDAHPASRAAPPRRISVRDAGVRSHFYSVKGDDGTYDTSTEQDLSRFETKALPVFREIDGRWPLRGQDRATVSEFVALQMARGPEWRAWMIDLGEASFARLRAGGQYPDLSEQDWARVKQTLLGDRGLLELMDEQISRIATMVGAMNWGLMSFKEEALITSDHPVCVIPIDAYRGRVLPQAAPRDGLMRTLEIRVPVNSRQALVLTWLPGADRRFDRAWAGHATNINFGIRAQADVHWFSTPGRNFSIPDRGYPTFTTAFDPTFTPQRLYRSTRRIEAQRLINRMVEDETNTKTIALVEMQ